MFSTKISLAKGIWSKTGAAHPCQKFLGVPPLGLYVKQFMIWHRCKADPVCDLTLTLTLTCIFVFKPVMTSVGVQASVEPAFVRVRPPPVVRLTLWPPWWRWLKDPSHWLWLEMFLNNHKFILTSLIVVFFSCWYNWSNCRFFLSHLCLHFSRITFWLITVNKFDTNMQFPFFSLADLFAIFSFKYTYKYAIMCQNRPDASSMGQFWHIMVCLYRYCLDYDKDSLVIPYYDINYHCCLHIHTHCIITQIIWSSELSTYALDGAVFDIAQILAYLVHNMSRFQLYLGFGHFGWLPSFFGQ